MAKQVVNMVSGGFRQGDPSPFWFMLVSDLLGRLVETVREASLLEGHEMRMFKASASHLQFTDDTV